MSVDHPILSVQDVSHRFRGGACLFSDVNLTLSGPCTTAITGPSGVGKTTLLAIIGGYLTPTSGRVSLAGVSARSSGFEVSWILQSSNAFGSRTVLDNVALPQLLAGVGRREAVGRSLEALEAVGLIELSKQKSRRLSGGELQRVGIARALASHPRLLLADEPTGQLDEAATQAVATALVGRRHPESTVIVVTHDPTVAARCDNWLTLSRVGLESVY